MDTKGESKKANSFGLKIIHVHPSNQTRLGTNSLVLNSREHVLGIERICNWEGTIITTDSFSTGSFSLYEESP